MRIDASSWAKLVTRTTTQYACGILATALAVACAWGIARLHNGYAPFFVVFLSVVFSAFYFGVGPAVVTTILSLVGARYWLVEPVHSLRILGISDWVGVLVFLLSAGASIVMGEARRRQNQSLRDARTELDELVKARTAELASANDSLRQLTGQLLQLQDEERRRFARELHDSVGQTLAALSMNLSLVRSDLDRMIKSANALSDSEALVQEMSKEIRTISHLLHPPLLDEAGLLPALRWYAEGFAQRSKIEVDLDISDDFGRLPRELETAVFRIVQECLTNIHRHSGSPIAKIRMVRSHDQVLIEVADAGKGISKEKQQELATSGTPGVGVRGMRERLRQLGGSLEISSNHHGTLVVVRLPIVTASVAAA